MSPGARHRDRFRPFPTRPSTTQTSGMQRIAALAIACVLAALAWQLPETRRRLIRDVVYWDAVPSEPATLSAGSGAGLSPAAQTRVVLVDGLSADVAATLPAWNAACARGTQALI